MSLADTPLLPSGNAFFFSAELVEVKEQLHNHARESDQISSFTASQISCFWLLGKEDESTLSQGVIDFGL